MTLSVPKKARPQWIGGGTEPFTIGSELMGKRYGLQSQRKGRRVGISCVSVPERDPVDCNPVSTAIFKAVRQWHTSVAIHSCPQSVRLSAGPASTQLPATGPQECLLFLRTPSLCHAAGRTIGYWCLSSLFLQEPSRSARSLRTALVVAIDA
ncbi:Hypothetical protein GSB_154100 [Giardia duodenalis]|uniref:Uncharacterized protein n=1 Tax=Giardia intestinalis TaxID=5741 RepID=V6TM96_GIAIN|nr:Hypothetical protein GSB_154100 [Giardia intestinalis]